jgi:hypothetical protein
VTALYQAHALGLIRLAVIMLGDRPLITGMALSPDGTRLANTHPYYLGAW